MDTLGKRIKHVIAYNGSTMTEFAKELKISQSMVSKICADKAIPSERTLLDICRIYNIKYDWLMYHKGEMVDNLSLQAELAEVFKKSFSADEVEIMSDFIATLASLPPATWSIVRDYANKLSDEYDKNSEVIDPYMAGYKAGVEAVQKAIEITKKADTK